MTTIRGTLLLGAALVLGSVVGAAAADLNYGGVKDGGYAAPMMAPEPRLYFRIDGGYAYHDDPVMVESGIYDLTDPAIDNTWTIGGGLGWYFSRNVRADLTVDHRFESDVQGTLADPAATLEGVRRFGLSSTVALANIYYDFDNRSRFTPYVGVGLGFVHHSTKDGAVDSGCLGTCTATIEGNSSWHVAAALMAGVSVNLLGHREQVMTSIKDAPVYTTSAGRALLLDVGYRFLYLGETQTGPVTFNCGGPCAQTVSDDPTVESVHAHEIRVGLRYNLR